MEANNGFIVIQGNKIEDLRELMVRFMVNYPLDPLDRNSILVQSNGIAQWVRLALASSPESSGGMGIAADMDIMLPARMIWKLYRSILKGVPEVSPYDKGPLTWRIFSLLGSSGELSDFPALQRYLSLDDKPGASGMRNRLKLAQQFSDLFDQYQIYRPDWLSAWSEGKNIIIRPDGQEVPLRETDLWQADLWRILVREINSDSTLGNSRFARSSRYEIHRAFLEEAKQVSVRPSRIPKRITVFGISAMPQQYLEALAAISHLGQVVLFAQNPSQHYWGDIIEGRHLFKMQYKRIAERKIPEDASIEDMHLHGHPLLAAWGRQGRDYMRLLDVHDESPAYASQLQQDQVLIDVFNESGNDTLLASIQDDILALRPLGERQQMEHVLDPDVDASIEFMVTHNRQREIEVLHDRLVDQFAQNPDLQPKEVLVMVPNIDDYSAHIESVFGRYKGSDRRHIPYHISDQSKSHENHFLTAFSKLLHVDTTRFTSTQILDLLDVAAIRKRFDIKESDLSLIREWIESANIRWGIDSKHKQSIGLPGSHENTFLFGLKRMIYGYAFGYMTENFDDVHPLGDVGGLDADIVGHLYAFIAEISRHLEEVKVLRTPTEWAEYMDSGVLNAFFSEDGNSDLIAITQITEAIQSWIGDCEQAGTLVETFDYIVVREHLLDLIDRPNLSQRFFAGSVNFATLMPMRAVPFRQIWLLGMNEGEYPRRVSRSSHDLMDGDYRPGDRSRREDDRYLFLEAMLSAKDKLVVSWNGRSDKDNSVIPPSILVGQLRDHLNEGWLACGESGVSESLTVEYPLNPYSRKYFMPDRDKRIFTYGKEWRESLDYTAENNSQPGQSFGLEESEVTVTLDDLVRFTSSPVDEFFLKRLGIGRNRDVSEVKETEQFDLRGLDLWKIRNDAIDELLRNSNTTKGEVSITESIQRYGEILKGGGVVGKNAHGELMIDEALTPIAKMKEIIDDELTPVDNGEVTGLPPMEFHIEGVKFILSGLPASTEWRDSENDRAQCIFSASGLIKNNKYNWKVAIDAWLKHVVANIAYEGTKTLLLTPSGNHTFAGIDKAVASQVLNDVFSAYKRGLESPLPAAMLAGFALLDAGLDSHRAMPTDDESLNLVQRIKTAYATDLERSEMLEKTYPDLSAMWNKEGSFGFIDFVSCIYGPLYSAVKAKKKSKAK